MSDKSCPPNDDPSMAGCRSRNDGDGQLRQKRGDTQAGTIEKEYGVDLGVRSDARLDTLRQRTGENSVEGVIRSLTKKR